MVSSTAKMCLSFAGWRARNVSSRPDLVLDPGFVHDRWSACGTESDLERGPGYVQDDVGVMRKNFKIWVREIELTAGRLHPALPFCKDTDDEFEDR
ncbi:hypothetical protein N7471_010166 [Penicillium samsonianum]|uniref:uncharacterized protein n=1 Tax=Penicillium samsonianum TaxID=1882272 RepID=UPI00254777AC|nr:uncharacterized protein N7471_010166 [Penicillium samsonianum]KAJ6128949.1 hypothetical protein N7471_010166 [Penicillium samsonianum]